MDDFSSARPNTEEGASLGAQSCQTYVSSRFAFRVTASWGAQSHNTVVSNRFAFRITASWGAQSHNAVVSSRFVFHGVPNPGTSVVPQQVHRLSCYGCVLLCVSRQCAEPHALRTPRKTRTSPFSPTSSKAIRWCSVTPLVPTSSGWHGGSCKCFAPLHEIGTRHIDAARQLQDRRCLWWLYRTRTQLRCVERVSSRGNATSPQQVVLRGCQSAARSNKAQ